LFLHEHIVEGGGKRRIDRGVVEHVSVGETSVDAVDGRAAALRPGTMAGSAMADKGVHDVILDAAADILDDDGTARRIAPLHRGAGRQVGGAPVDDVGEASSALVAA